MIKLLNAIFAFSFKFYFWMKYRIFRNPLFRFGQKMFHYHYLSYFGVDTKFGYVTLVGLPIIDRCSGSKIRIEKGVTLVSNSKGNVAGINHPVILATMAPGASIWIKPDCGLSGSSVCAVKSVVIEEKTGLGVNTSIYDTDFHTVDQTRERQESVAAARAKPVKIGRCAWVGANSLILKGVSIGEGAVIGAGSVVRTDIDKFSIAIGNPAKVVRVLPQ
jgi:acetyltransferase-like isoleucine patch superfamily enzyme